MYEVHITDPEVELDSTWKQLVIELDSGDNPIQPMYSRYLKGEYETVYNFVKDIPCSRLKIEQYGVLPEHCEHPNYFEFHIKALKEDPYLETRPYGAHLSRNPQKDGRFLTLRGYVTLTEITQRFNWLKYNLEKRNIPYSNIQREYVVYDSNITLDNNWK